MKSYIIVANCNSYFNVAKFAFKEINSSNLNIFLFNIFKITFTIINFENANQLKLNLIHLI